MAPCAWCISLSGGSPHATSDRIDSRAGANSTYPRRPGIVQKYIRLSPSDRPREKLVRLGPAGLGDNELIAAVLGQGANGCDALELAAAILDRSGGPGGLPRVGVDDLRQLRGVGVARAAQILAAVELGRRTLSAPAARRRSRRPRPVADWMLPQSRAQ